MSILLPGYEQMPLAGVPGFAYDEYDDPKALLHSTEGTSIEGAVSAYRAYPPHLIVDPWKRRKVQHISLDRAAYALWNGDADDSRCIQVEIVGFAGQSHTWPDEVLRWLGTEVARPLHEYAGVPYVVVWKGFRRDGEMPYALADADSPLRLTQTELDSFSGFLGHQHVPGDSHWDPGGLNVARILQHAQEEDVTAEDVWRGIKIGYPGDKWTATPAEWVPSIDRHVSTIRFTDMPALRALMSQVLAAVTNDADITPDAVRRIVDEATSKAAQEQAALIVAQINSGIAALVEDALQRVQAGDNAAEVEELLRRIGSLATAPATT